MIEVGVTFPKIAINYPLVNSEADKLALNIQEALVGYTRNALIALGAVATGRNYRAIKGEFVTSRRLALFGVAQTGLVKRRVVGDESLKYIISGRKAGAKMPVRVAGTGPRGGKIFEPLPAMLRWFTFLAIPKSAWFPILRAIKANGIKPRNVPQRALEMAQPSINAFTRHATANIARGIIKVTN